MTNEVDIRRYLDLALGGKSAALGDLVANIYCFIDVNNLDPKKAWFMFLNSAREWYLQGTDQEKCATIVMALLEEAPTVLHNLGCHQDVTEVVTNLASTFIVFNLEFEMLLDKGLHISTAALDYLIVDIQTVIEEKDIEVQAVWDTVINIVKEWSVKEPGREGIMDLFLTQIPAGLWLAECSHDVIVLVSTVVQQYTDIHPIFLAQGLGEVKMLLNKLVEQALSQNCPSAQTVLKEVEARPDFLARHLTYVEQVNFYKQATFIQDHMAKGLKALRSGVNAGDPDALMMYKEEYSNDEPSLNRRPEPSAEGLESMAKQDGCPEAALKIGKAYLSGKVYPEIKQNIEKGLRYLKIAADKGHPEALLELARALAAGKGFRGIKQDKQDFKDGLSYFKLAAEQGNPVVLFELGKALATGSVYRGIEQNIKEGFAYLELAASKGNPEAMLLLQKMYFDHGGYANEDYFDKGIQWLTTLVERQDDNNVDCFKMEALLRLIQIYKNGVDVYGDVFIKPDKEKAEAYSMLLARLCTKRPDFLFKTPGFFKEYAAILRWLESQCGQNGLVAGAINQLAKTIVLIPSLEDAYAVVELYEFCIQSGASQSIDTSVALQYCQQAVNLIASAKQSIKHQKLEANELNDKVELAKYLIAPRLPGEMWAKVNDYLDPTSSDGQKAIEAMCSVSKLNHATINHLSRLNLKIDLSELALDKEKNYLKHFKDMHVYGLQLEFIGINQHPAQFSEVLESLAANPHKPQLSLKMANCYLSVEELTTMSRLSNVVGLAMISCDLQEDKSLAFIKGWKQLTMLDLTNTQFNSQGFSVITTMSMLTRLSISGCGIKSTTGLSGLYSLSVLKNLEYLALGNYASKTEYIHLFSYLTSLKELSGDNGKTWRR